MKSFCLRMALLLTELLREKVISVTGTIKRMAQAVIEGNSHFYITLEPETQKITGPDQGNITPGADFDF